MKREVLCLQMKHRDKEEDYQINSCFHIYLINAEERWILHVRPSLLCSRLSFVKRYSIIVYRANFNKSTFWPVFLNVTVAF